MRAKRFGWILPICLGALLPAVCAAQAKAPSKAGAGGTDPALLHPEKLTEKAPDVFRVKFTTTKGSVVVEVTRAWAPLGADRFYNLVKHHYFDQASFFRVLKSPRPFVVQFGINADPKVNAVWQGANIKDDPVTQHNVRGTITFAMGGKDTRTSQVFINLADNSRLDAMGFPPFGSVVEGMSVVEDLYGDYGEGAPSGRGPDQGRIQSEGKPYLDKEFPKLDSIVTAVIVVPEGSAPAKTPAKAPAKSPGL
ncbi:MAG TPA: peptidylprolyl isomerase [Candidatus Acidoferrales bacterium]|nr:peptidylprolyl isomerase [Candidatus Acidoferrales bacterium]